MQVGETFVQGLFIIFRCSGQFGKLLILFIFLIFLYFIFKRRTTLKNLSHAFLSNFISNGENKRYVPFTKLLVNEANCQMMWVKNNVKLLAVPSLGRSTNIPNDRSKNF